MNVNEMKELDDVRSKAPTSAYSFQSWKDVLKSYVHPKCNICGKQTIVNFACLRLLGKKLFESHSVTLIPFQQGMAGSCICQVKLAENCTINFIILH